MNRKKQTFNFSNSVGIFVRSDKKKWIKIASACLVPLVGIGSTCSVNAIDIKNNMLYEYISNNKSTVKKVAAISSLGVLTLGSALLINYYVNRLPDLEKLENRIIGLHKKLVSEKVVEYEEYVRLINDKLVCRIKSKYSLTKDALNLTSQSGLVIFNEQVLKIVKNDPKYFKENIIHIVELMKFLNKNTNKLPYRGLSNPGLYCYLNSAVQMLSADEDLCDILSSNDKMRQCFEDYKKCKDSKHESLNNEIENFENCAKTKLSEIINIIKELPSDDLNKCLPNDIANILESDEVEIVTFYEKMFSKIAYDDKNENWEYENILRNRGENVSKTYDVKSVIYNLFSNDDLKKRFDILTNEYFEIYSNYDRKRQNRGMLNSLNNDNSYELASLQFEDPNNEILNKKLLKMMRFVNNKICVGSDLGGKDLADTLVQRDNNNIWHSQNDVSEVIMNGFNIPMFVMNTIICYNLNLTEAFKENVNCAPYVLVLAQRDTTNPHGTAMNLVETITTDDNSKYELISFSCHRGCANSGHWWAVRKDKSRHWWECNDKHISKVGNSKVCLNNKMYKRGATYLLYKKIK